MAKTREKKVLLSGTISRDKAEDAFAEFAEADARQQQLSAKRDIEMTRIREKYADEISRFQDQKDLAFDKLQAYAQDHREEFGSKKSMEFTHGILGFRKGNPSLKTAKGFTWNSVINLLREFLPTYLRTVEEIAKDRLIADREDPEVNKLFGKVGIYVDQNETFFVEPKKEEVAI